MKIHAHTNATHMKYDGAACFIWKYMTEHQHAIRSFKWLQLAWQAANVHHLKHSHVLHLYPDCWIKGKYQQHKKVRGVVEGRKRLVLMPEEDEAGDGESHEDDDKQGNEVE